MPEGNITGRQEQLPIGQALSLGFKVLFSEIQWQILRGLRLWEIKQMSSRLSKEYEKLGKLLESQNNGSANSSKMQSEIDLCRRQIDFLSREVEHLQTQLRNLRRDIIAKRRKKWDI